MMVLQHELEQNQIKGIMIYAHLLVQGRQNSNKLKKFAEKMNKWNVVICLWHHVPFFGYCVLRKPFPYPN